MNFEFQIPVVGSTTPKSGLEVWSVWLWPQLGQYWEVSGTSELQYQQVVMGADSRPRAPAAALGKPRWVEGLAERISSMTDQGELFPLPAGTEPAAPLATRMRPKTFAELVGQRQVVDVLRKLTQAGNLPSIILWGPPGSGKTTLAGLLAGETSARM